MTDEKQHFKFRANYAVGYRNGRLDRINGHFSVVAQTSPLPGYAAGYIDGYSERVRGILRKNAEKWGATE